MRLIAQCRSHVITMVNRRHWAVNDILREIRKIQNPKRSKDPKIWTHTVPGKSASIGQPNLRPNTPLKLGLTSDGTCQGILPSKVWRNLGHSMAWYQGLPNSTWWLHKPQGQCPSQRPLCFYATPPLDVSSSASLTGAACCSKQIGYRKASPPVQLPSNP